MGADSLIKSPLWIDHLTLRKKQSLEVLMPNSANPQGGPPFWMALSMGKWGPFNMGYNSTYNWLGSHLATIPPKLKILVPEESFW